jgi:hypothetical protein
MVKSPSTTLLVGAAVVVFGAVAAIATAGDSAVPGVHNGVVTACIEPPTKGNRATSGDLNVLVCLKGARRISWNIRGPRGVRGLRGLAGPAGAQGAQGPAGAAGAQGALGPAGAKGDTGAAGPAGVVNATFDADAPATTTAAVQADFADFTGGSLIRDLTLPAGSYDIEAQSSVRGASDGPVEPALNTRLRCNLVNATVPTSPVSLDTFYQDFFRPDEASPGFRESLDLGVLATFAVQTKIELRCYSVRPNGGTAAGQVPSSKIVATQVTTITAGH